MGNKYKLFLYPKAKKDLDDIFYYISEELKNKTAILNLIKKIKKSFDNICCFPQSCPLINNEYVKDNDLRKLVIDNYIAFYKIDNVNLSINVVRVLYGMSNWEKIL